LPPHEARNRDHRAPAVAARAAWLGAWVAWLGPPAFVLYMNRFQIAAEERALAQRFGPAFGSYAARVRRWI
jgi:protein-S-isoprenylcysteine O-methyltransferase Ste14